MDNFHLFLNTHLNKQHLKDYKIVKGTVFPPNTGILSFEEDIKKWICLGYVPCGNFSSSTVYELGMFHETTLYQAMCLYGKEDDKK